MSNSNNPINVSLPTCSGIIAIEIALLFAFIVFEDLFRAFNMMDIKPALVYAMGCILIITLLITYALHGEEMVQMKHHEDVVKLTQQEEDALDTTDTYGNYTKPTVVDATDMDIPHTIVTNNK